MFENLIKDFPTHLSFSLLLISKKIFHVRNCVECVSIFTYFFFLRSEEGFNLFYHLPFLQILRVIIKVLHEKFTDKFWQILILFQFSK